MSGWGREQSRGKKEGETDAGDGERVLGPLGLLLSLQGSSRHIHLWPVGWMHPREVCGCCPTQNSEVTQHTTFAVCFCDLMAWFSSVGFVLGAQKLDTTPHPQQGSASRSRQKEEQ